MPEEPFHRMPSEVTISAGDVIAVINRLEAILGEVEERRSPFGVAPELDEIIGLLTRWLWPLARRT
jgi:hypothetical protein